MKARRISLLYNTRRYMCSMKQGVGQGSPGEQHSRRGLPLSNVRREPVQRDQRPCTHTAVASGDYKKKQVM